MKVCRHCVVGGLCTSLSPDWTFIGVDLKVRYHLFGGAAVKIDSVVFRLAALLMASLIWALARLFLM